MNGIYDLLQQIMANPEFQMAYTGIAGQTTPAQTAINGAAPVVGTPAGQAPPPSSIPDSRIANAFQDAGTSPAPDPALMARAQGANDQAPHPAAFVDDMMSALNPGAQQQAPAPSSAFVDDIMGGVNSGSGGILPDGIGNYLSDALSALAVGDPTAPPLTAFGQGFAGAQAGGRSRLERKRAEQKDERDYQWKLEDRTHGRQREGVEDQRWERDQDLEERKAARDERMSNYEEIAATVGIRKTQAELRKIDREYQKSGLTIDQSIEVERLVNDYIKNNLGNFPNEKSRASVNTAADAYRKTLMESFPKADDGLGGSTTVPRGIDTSGLTGTGTTAQDPIRFNSDMDGEQVLIEKFLATGKPVYFIDEHGRTLEYPPE